MNSANDKSKQRLLAFSKCDVDNCLNDHNDVLIKKLMYDDL